MKKITQLFAIALLTCTVSQPIFAAEDSSNANQTSAASLATTDTSSNPTTTSTTTGTSTAAKPATKTKVMSMSSVLQQVQKTGSIVKSADFDKDNSKYKVDVVDKHGESQSLDVDATKGLSADQKKTPHEVPLAQAVKKLEKSGTYVKSVSADANGYKATVVDSQGNSKDYKIDRQTGNVSQ